MKVQFDDHSAGNVMTSIADELPPEVAQAIDPAWRANETAYWAVRDHLLPRYRDQWVGFADGAVVAFGGSPVAVFHAAEAAGGSPFVTCVGREDEPCMMRRATFSGRVGPAMASVAPTHVEAEPRGSRRT